MCGRYYLNTPRASIAARFGVTTFEEEPFDSLNLVPSQMMQVILNVSPQTVSRAKWGFIPSWMKDAKGGHKPINAVGETVATNGYFRAAFKGRKCLVIASGFYEWERVDGKAKQPYKIFLKSGEPFAMAGVWDIWQAPDGEVRTFAIVTVPSNEVVGRIHDRMPVFLHPEDEQVWLDTTTGETGAAQALIKPFPAELMTMEPVSSDTFKRPPPPPKQGVSLFDLR